MASAPTESLAAAPEDLVPGATLGQYRLIEQLGAGGMGEVYRAHDTELQRDVALKVVQASLASNSAAMTRFRREARLLASVNHPNIATIHGFEETSAGVRFLVMELVEGETLDARLRGGGPLPAGDAIRIGGQIASALAAAHRRGVIHRDLKPGNVMQSPEGWVKVLDFGLAKALGANVRGADVRGTDVRGEALSSLTETTDSLLVTVEESLTVGQMGTAPYMSPEQIRQETIDSRSDIWAFGCVLFEMLTGRRLFTGRNRFDTFTSILTQEPLWELLPPRTPEPLKELLQACLQKDPADRPASMNAVRDKLHEMAQLTPPSGLVVTDAPWQSADGVVTGLGASASFVPPTPIPRRRWFAAALVAAIVLTALVVVAVLRGWFDGGSTGAGFTNVDSVVVMPSRLLNITEAPYLADAIPHTISGHLSRVQGLEAKLPPTAYDIERLGGDVSRVARAYEAETMVLSTTSIQQGRLVLDLQLVETGTRNLLWSQVYQGDQEAFLDLARRAAEGLQQALRPGAGGLRFDAPVDPGVEMQLQQGRYYANLYRNLGRESDMAQALAAYERALELDPRRADTAGEIAVLHTFSLDRGVAIAEVQAEVERWARKALDLDPNCSKAWAALGEIEPGIDDESMRRKLEYLLRAATYAPSDGYAANRLSAPLAYLSFTLALASSREASSVDPLVLTAQVFEAMCLSALGNQQGALARVEHALSIEPGLPLGLLIRGMLLSFNRRDQDALDFVGSELEPLVAQGTLSKEWVDLTRDLALFGQASANGATATADAAAARLIAMARGEVPFARWQGGTMQVAAHLARWGRHEDAAELLRYRSRMDIFQPYDYLLLLPEFEPIRDNLIFREALAESQARFEDALAILEAARAQGEMPAYLEVPLSDLMQRIDEAEVGV